MIQATRLLAFERRLGVLVITGGIGVWARQGPGDLRGAIVEGEDRDQSRGDLRAQPLQLHVGGRCPKTPQHPLRGPLLPFYLPRALIS
jgi:hypothetical protein